MMARPACTIVPAGQQVGDEYDEYVVRRLLWVVVVLVVVTSITYVVLIVMLCNDPAVTSADKTPTRSRTSASNCCNRNSRLVARWDAFSDRCATEWSRRRGSRIGNDTDQRC
jgi:hypothetical protein